MQTPTLSPGVLKLLSLEGEFSAAVSAGGGRAFSSWFADDGVTLNNGQPAVRGRIAIAAAANWDPAQYKLSWYAEGAQMGPSNDTGFTWGHYDATTIGKDGKSTTTSGRYITFWKKVDGKWKVALDASANEPPPANGMPTP
jgi:ketosteroid isomerase-like protein